LEYFLYLCTGIENIMDSKSAKELKVESEISSLVNDMVSRFTDGDNLPLKMAEMLLVNNEVKSIQDYANTVSISRLGLNDHGPVHMKIVCRNALQMLSILHEAGVKTSLEQDKAGTFADSMSAVMIASLLHDSGMTIGRKDHELYSGIISYGIITDILKDSLPGEQYIARRTIIRAVAMEGIIGHMATHPIHSIEAGLILIADGCDMTKGRARITLEIPTKPTEGDIHKYSAHSIEKVKIGKGSERPLKIEVKMKSEVGFFQVEEVLIPKLQSSPAKHLIELYAGVEGEDVKRYI